jgi:cation diffusion facilitator CzcD-associated flavoprotein CzcO
MAVDTPATIAILGAGPIGLEAALYARYLGYDVTLLESANHVAPSARWGHVPMFTPFGENHSPLGLAAVQMHHGEYVPPRNDDYLTGEEWYQRYLLPLSQTDLLADHLRMRRHVKAVTKTELLKTDSTERADWMFRIVTDRGNDGEEEFEAEIVVDVTGAGISAWAGEGGAPALGEEQHLGFFIQYGLPNLSWEAPRKRFAGQRVLVIGSGYSAATNVAALVRLKREVPETDITWLVRQSVAPGDSPLRRIPNDTSPGRRALADSIDQLVAAETVRVISGSWVRRIESLPDGLIDVAAQVTFGGQCAQSEEFNAILANVGHKPNRDLFRELQVHLDPVTESPLRADVAGPQSLITTEPNFYILGSKSYGRRSRDFCFTDGLKQIRDLFAIVGDRPTLDLYANAPRVE